MDSINLHFEGQTLSNNSKESIIELRKLSDFFKTFITTHQEEVSSFQKKLNSPDNKHTLHPSILLTNLTGIYDYFQEYISNIQKLMTKINNELLNPIDEFSSEQSKIYKENLKKLNEIYNNYKESKNLLDFAKNNYYEISFNTKIKEHEIKNNPVFKGEDSQNDTKDTLLKYVMMSKNAEYFYKCELDRYNKTITEINTEYNNIIEKIQIAEKSRIYFIKASVDKYRNYLVEYNKNINSFVEVLQNYINDDICQKDEKFYLKEIGKYIIIKDKNYRIPKEDFVSFNEFSEKMKIFDNKDNKNIENNFKIELTENNKIKKDLKECTNFIENFLKNLIKEEDISLEEIAKLYVLLKSYDNEVLPTKNKSNNNQESIEQVFIDCLLNLKKGYSLKFINMKNLDHLANIISLITLNNSDLLDKKFELNFKIIFISDKIFYQNQSNNNKIYLSAILSKNKYYCTKQFWRNIMTLKLAHKLNDHIERLKKIVLPEERRKSIFGKLGDKIGIKNTLHKHSLVSKSRLLPLLKDYNEIEESKVPIIDKMYSQEMSTIIKESIPSLSNFNFPGDDYLDFISELIEEFKISNEFMKFLIIYANVSSYTIIKSLSNKVKNSFNFNSFQKKDDIHKKIKLLSNAIPYLTNKDYNNLLLVSKEFNQKLKKKVYSYVLKQNNNNHKIRLKIWQNILGINKIKEEYNYTKILDLNMDSNLNISTSSTDDKVKNQIKLDMTRTNVGDSENKDEIKNKITNILYAISKVNDDIRYCQGMNYIGQFLYEIFGEEEAFYIFLGIFKNTEYPLIIGTNLKRINIFFYVFKRLISLFEPELSSHLNGMGIDVNCFLPQWYITLFTGAHQYWKEFEDNTTVITRILDGFIIFGWKTMMSIGCSILHSYENELLNMKYEELMQFLIGDILKSKFFSSKNERIVIECLDNIKISKKLIKNIEDEYNIEAKIKEKKQ